MSSSRIYFIILNFNGYEDTIECLQSLRQLTYKDFQVILVDNASANDEGARLANEFPEYIHISNTQNSGFAGGNNIGIARALEEDDCQYLFFLNNDTTVESDMLDQLMKDVKKPEYSIYGAFQPNMINYYQHDLIDTAGLEYSFNTLGFGRGMNHLVTEFKNNQEVLGCSGGAFLCRRSAVEDLLRQAGDFFAEEFFAYYEDFDTALRLRWAGWRAILIVNSIVYHKNGRTANKTSGRKVFWLNRNIIWVVIRNWPTSEIIKNFHLILLGQIGMVVNTFLRRGRLGWLALKGKKDALALLLTMWHYRKAIQSKHKNWQSIKKFMVLKWRP